jgi:PIG-X / PBN1
MGIALSWGVSGETGATAVLIMSCHAPLTSPEQDLAISCCEAMSRATQSATRTQGTRTMDSLLLFLFNMFPYGLVGSNTLAEAACQTEGSLVPYSNNTSSPSAAMRFLYQITTRNTLTEQQERDWNTSSLNTLHRHHFLWNDGLRDGYWWGQTPHKDRDRDLESNTPPNDASEGEYPKAKEHQWTSRSPEWLESLFGNHLQCSFPNYHSNTIARTQNFTFQSTLSLDGGMHRLLEHTIEIPLHQIRQNLRRTTGPGHFYDVLVIQRLTGSFLLLIPSDMFMDAEDAFDQHQWKVHLVDSMDGLTTTSSLAHPVQGNYSLTLHSHKVMDIEQPAFASPQHAVMVHLNWNATTLLAKDDDVPSHFVLRFATKLHLRYPAPNVLSKYTPVVLMPPLWMQGHLAVSMKLTRDNIPEEIILDLQPQQQQQEEHLLGFFQPSRTCKSISLEDHATTKTHPNVQFLTTQVATGIQGDFAWVATVTVIFSVIGATLLGYETSRIASLNAS